MSEITVIYDVDNENWQVSSSDINSIFCDISITFLREVTKGGFIGLDYGYQLFKDDEIVQENTILLSQFRIVNTEKLSPVQEKLLLSPDAGYTLKLWVTFNGIKKEHEFSFNTPIPIKPYPSHVWVNNTWIAPTPFPGDGKRYLWDEPTLSWVLEEQ
jgi:hypothetical protein